MKKSIKFLAVAMAAFAIGFSANNYAISDVPSNFRVATVDIQEVVASSAQVKALKKESAEILVTGNLDMAFGPILRVVDGLVIENPTEMDEEILSLINPNLIWISQVTDAMKKLEPGSTVTIDSSEKIVYEGTV